MVSVIGFTHSGVWSVVITEQLEYRVVYLSVFNMLIMDRSHVPGQIYGTLIVSWMSDKCSSLVSFVL